MNKRPITFQLITILFFIAVVVYFVVQTWRYFTRPELTTTVYTYRAEHTVSLSGFVVRDEAVVDCDDPLVDLTRTEGERVSKGKAVATVYRSAEALDAARELAELREQLAQFEYAQSAARDTETALRLDSEIEGDIVALRAAFASGNYAALDNGGTALKTAVLKREYAYRGGTDLGGRVEALKERASVVSGMVGGAARTVSAPFAGTWSAVADGYETVLTPEALKTLTPAEFQRLSPVPVTATAGKLIRGETWYYAAVVSAADAARFAEGASYELAISGADAPLPVVAQSVGRAQDGKCLLVFKSDRYLSAVTMLRAQSAELILDSYTGLRIPKNALRIGADGQIGVYCRIGLQSYFKPVELIYQGEDYCLVRPGEIHAVRESDLVIYTLRAGDEVIVSADELYDGKVIE